MSIICFQKSYEIINYMQQLHKYLHSKVKSKWIFHMWWILLCSINYKHIVFNELLRRWRRVREKLCCNATWTIQAHATNVQPKVHQKYKKYCDFSFPATATTLHCVQLNCSHSEEYTRSTCDLESCLCNINYTDEYVIRAGIKFRKCGLHFLGSFWKLSPPNHLHFHIVVFFQSTMLMLPLLFLVILHKACAIWNRCKRGDTFCQFFGNHPAC